MRTYLVAVKRLAQAHYQPGSAIADALDGILTPDMLKHPGSRLALVDWAVGGDEMAASIASVPLTDDYRPDESAFPAWPGRTIP
jgi:hypothetical protein